MTPRTRKKPERRPSPLTREQIIETAIGLLDAAGESGLTFRVLSERLATGPGAIYWHVASKSELLAAATDHAVAAALSEEAVAGPPGGMHDVALGLFRAIERHPWLAPQLTAEISHNPAGPVTTRIFETIGRQVYALGVPASRWFTATSALMHYILGAAGQNAANLARASSLGPETDRGAYMDAVTARWQQLSPQEYPFTRAVADHGLDHDDRAQFLAGIDLITGGITAGHAH